MESKKYHKDVYLPEYIRDKVPKNIHQINYSDHALFRAKQRNVLLPTWICYPELVEVTYGKRLKGFVFRLRHNLKQDLCLAFSCSKTKIICVTCWLNDRSDQHNSLDMSKYVRENGR